jgi:hypothetical protein
MAPGRPEEAVSIPPARSEWAWTAAAALVVTAFSLVFLLHDRQYFWNDDFQTYQLAGYREVGRAWSHGEVPLLSPYSWFGGALAGEFQNGVFSVFLTGLALVVFPLGLSLPYAAATFAIVHLAVLAAGSFRLARTRGLPPNLALLAALVAALNGWTFLWGARQWFPALASFAWFPWTWWALERALRPGAGWRRSLPAGVFLYLAVTAGWPFTVLMLAVLSAWLTVRTLGQRRWTAAWPVAAAWLIGLGLSAPAWLMLLEYAGETVRGATPLTQVTRAWLVPPAGWLGLVFPSYIGPWPVFFRWKDHACAEMTGGLVPVAVLAATLVRHGRDFLYRRGWELGLGFVLFVLCVSPSLGNFQYPFRWLPFFFLVLGLLAAHGLQALRARAEAAPSTRPPNPGLWAVAAVLVVWGRALWFNRDPTTVTLVHGVCLLATCLGWAVVESRRIPVARLRPWLPGALLLVSCSFMYVNYGLVAEVPTWRVDEHLYERPPLDAGVRYLSVYACEDVLGDQPRGPLNPGWIPGIELFPGNTATYAGVEMVNGYSPMGPRGLARVCGIAGHGYFTGGAGDRLLVQEAGPGGLLQLMGVDGLVVAERFLTHQARLEAAGWRPTAEVQGGRVFRRTAPPSPRVHALGEAVCCPDPEDAVQELTAVTGRPAPRVLSGPGSGTEGHLQTFATAQLGAVEEGRNVVSVDVANPSEEGEALVAFSRPWHAGYRAEYAGRPLPVLLLDLTMPAVRLPPGTRGRLVLRYEPRSFVAGVRAAAATSGILLLILAIASVRRFAVGRPAAPARAEAALCLTS